MKVLKYDICTVGNNSIDSVLTFENGRRTEYRSRRDMASDARAMHEHDRFQH